MREWLARWLGVGKARRLRAETRAEALTTAYRRKLVTELHNLKILDIAKPFDFAQDKAQGRPFDPSTGLRTGFAQGRPFDLETSYVPLRLSLRCPFDLAQGVAQGFGSGQTLQVREYNGRGEFTAQVGEGDVVQREDKAMSPEEALLRFHRLTVLGDPGAGKTTMLRYLALLAATPPASPPRVGGTERGGLPDFPILVSLGHFAAVPQVNLLDFVISEVETRYGFSEPRPDGSTSSPRGPVEGPRPDSSTGSPHGPVEGLRPYLEERLEEGSVLFLLDGLDEASVGPPFSSPPRVGGIEGGAEATYRHVVGQINVLAARYPHCPIVVTAQQGSWKGLLAASFHNLEVLEFSGDDIQRFIINWFGTGSDRARDLQDALSQNPRMWALAANPLLLSLMAFAFEQDGELPEGRAGLYRRGVELLLSAADGENLTYTEHKLSLLEEVALHFHLRRVFLFPEDELREVIASYLTAVDIPADQVATMLEEISGQNGLLREQVAGWYGFPHPTWQEYLAAVAISKSAVLSLSKGGQIGLVLEGLHDPWWEGMTLFLAEVLEDATPLLESILAQEEDIFHSNLLLAGRCLAMRGLEPTRRPEGVGLDIIEGLKRLVEGGYHRLLQRKAVSVLAEIGGEAIVSFFVALLRRREIDPNMLAEAAQVLGFLHDKSIVPDLLAFLTDDKLDPSVRGNIAGALGSLGACPERSRRDESVIPPLLALLPDEMVDPSVRGRVVEALATLGGESIASPLLALLPDEGIDPYVRERITKVLASLGDKSLVSQLLSLLPDEKIHPSVRRGVAEALGSLGDKSAIPDLLALLSDEKIDSAVRGKVAEALGTLGAESAIPPLLAILDDEKVNYSVRMTIAEVLGALGDESIASQFLALLSDEKIDPDVRASIAGALGVLDEKSVIPQLLSLLSDEKIDPAVRWRIVDALSSLGDKTLIPHLRALLPNEKIDSSVRWMVAEALDALAEERGAKREITEIGEGEEALGSLDDRSRVPQFLALLKDERLDPSVSGRIIEALGSLGDDRATVEGLATLLDREDIGSSVYEALFHVSQRAGMRVFARKGQGYEVRPLNYS